MADLIKVLIAEHGFVENQTKVILPTREKTISALSPQDLDAALSHLPGWEPVESAMPQDFPNSRHELWKVFRFKSSKAALTFMNDAVPKINELKHDPRWENQWRSVTVYLSTWDIGNRITELDVELARQLDKMYAARSRKRST